MNDALPGLICGTVEKSLNIFLVLAILIFKIIYPGLFYIPETMLNAWTIFFLFFVFLPFLRLLLRHMEVPRLGVNQSCIHRPMPQPQQRGAEPCRVCSLHHSSQQHRILNPLSKARDRTCNQSDSFPLRHNGNSSAGSFNPLCPAQQRCC